MATATVALKLSNPLTSVPADMTRDSQVLNGAATVSNANYVTSGLPLTWVGTITDFAGKGFLPQSNQTAPYDATFKSNSGSGYDYQWDAALDTLRIFLAGTELTNGEAIPAGVQNDVIAFRAYFLKA